jgi:predicted nicotinamide N-methyase
MHPAATLVTQRPVSMNASDFRGKTVLDVGAGSGMCVKFAGAPQCLL